MFCPGDIREQEASRLEAEIAEVCGLLNAATAKLTGLIADVLATESWTGVGVRSPEHWVAWQCGVSPSRAHKLVVMARRLIELPVAAAAFEAGELSEDQVSVVVRHAPAHNDAEVTQLARHATVSQLSRTLRSFPFVEPPGADPEREQPVEERRDVSISYTDVGRWRLSADLPADEGALIERSLVAQRARLFADAETGDEVTWADALVAMADSAATAKHSGRTHPDRSTVLLHLGTDHGAALAAHLHGGPALPDALRRHLTCDTRVRPVWETDGKPVSIGRARRTVPDGTRLVVEERDRGCRVPGCIRTRWLHMHHIVHWEDGGATDTENLISLCGAHHRSHHRGLLGITGNADAVDGVQFTDQRGRPLRPNAPPVPPNGPPQDAARALGIAPGRYRHPSGERMDNWSVAFTPFSERTPSTGSHTSSAADSQGRSSGSSPPPGRPPPDR